jgi:hypothetical protein
MVALIVVGTAVVGLGGGVVLYALENWQEVKTNWFGIQQS